MSNAIDIMRSTAQALYTAGHLKEGTAVAGLLAAALEARVYPEAHNVMSVQVADIMGSADLLCTDGARMPRVRDAIVYAFGWPNRSTGISETHQVFSSGISETHRVFSAGKWLVSGDWWRGMVGNGPFLAHHRGKDGRDRALVSFPHLRHAKHYYGKHTLIGSQLNFGHFIHDHIGVIAAARALPDAHERTLVFGMLSEKQRECVKLAGVLDDEIIELQCSVGAGSTAYFEDLAVPTGVSFRRRSDNVRSWARGPAVEGTFPRKVYVSRTDGRVANKADVDALFKAHGYDVIEDIARRPIREQMSMFGQVTHLAWSFGADAVAAAMCGLDTHAVVLQPTFRTNIYDTTMDFGPRVRPVYGSEVNRLEEPCTYDLDAIARVIESR
jgi:hypothetical protein